jgi:MYXO-CTERM domain-containing protein
VLRHPAKFPETLAQEFIEFFTHAGQVVLDPMAGTGSALVAAFGLLGLAWYRRQRGI